MSDRPSDNWATVSKFMSDLRNVSRLGAYVDTVVDVYESGAWRRYTDATGRTDEWHESEFDYFLIACGARYGEVQRLLTWDRARAVELASAMESDDAAARRPLAEVSEQWPSPTGATLAELATRQGWTKGGGRLRVSPAPQRARARARHGLSMDELAGQMRAQKIAVERRGSLDRIASDAAEATQDELELRYVIDRLRDKLPRRRATSGEG
jgi:hypothetical protein